MEPPVSPPPAEEHPHGTHGTGLTGKHRNGVLVWLVWPLITLGIYHLVWWFKINREAREFDNRIKVSPGLSVLALFPGAFIIVPPYISVFRTGERISRAQLAAGISNRVNPWVGLILSFIFSLHTLYYQLALNQIWTAYGSPTPGTEVAPRR
jgi:hypothetical protein